DRFAALFAAAGAAGDLCQQLKRAFRRAKVGEAEADVGRHDADERHARKVVPFGDHLRPDEHVDLAVAEAREQQVERALAANGVAVEARDAGARTQSVYFRLHALGAEAGLLEVRSGAERARLRDARRVVAVVAARAAGRAVAVHDERHAAVRAVDRPCTLPA